MYFDENSQIMSQYIFNLKIDEILIFFVEK